MVVALRAADGQTEHTFADGVHAIKHRLHAELLRIHTAFFIDHRVTQKTRGDDLVLGCVRKQVACDLLNDELIVGKVAIECIDHPVAIEPDESHGVLFITVRVCVMRCIQPVAAPALAMMLGGQQFLDGGGKIR